MIKKRGKKNKKNAKKTKKQTKNLRNAGYDLHDLGDELDNLVEDIQNTMMEQSSHLQYEDADYKQNSNTNEAAYKYIINIKMRYSEDPATLFNIFYMIVHDQDLLTSLNDISMWFEQHTGDLTIEKNHVNPGGEGIYNVIKAALQEPHNMVSFNNIYNNIRDENLFPIPQAGVGQGKKKRTKKTLKKTKKRSKKNTK